MTTPASPDADLLGAYGWTDRWAALFAEYDAPGVEPARVVRHDGVALLSAFADGLRQVPTPRDVDPLPVAGDWLVVSTQPEDQVVAVLPRSSLLRRRDPMAEEEQPLVANQDLVVVVCGLDRPVKVGRIERSVAVAWDADATPVVVLTKADVADDGVETLLLIEDSIPGVDVLLLSAVSGEGMDALVGLMAGQTSSLLGESGAGKSTLVNALLGEQAAETGVVRGGDKKGRHTTTARTLHLLPGGGVVVDTPGIRAVGLWTDEESVAAAFDDIDDLAEGCRFRDCQHEAEPGCAVRAAVDDGTLPEERYESWRQLRREAMSSARRADEHERRKYERRFGKVVKEAQQHKRP